MNQKPTDNELSNLRRIKACQKSINIKIGILQAEFDKLMLLVPQPPDDDVPVGYSDNDNVHVKYWAPTDTIDTIK